MIKVAVVIPKYGLVGGAEGFVSALTERLAMRNEFEILKNHCNAVGGIFYGAIMLNSHILRRDNEFP
ncbi:MAG: hypothetical protein JRD04_01375 [Deltaproteobacteria bacterium]|nr:hypothetical protein [Deltaproteobacteria bacterium]